MTKDVNRTVAVQQPSHEWREVGRWHSDSPERQALRRRQTQCQQPAVETCIADLHAVHGRAGAGGGPAVAVFVAETRQPDLHQVFVLCHERNVAAITDKAAICSDETDRVGEARRPRDRFVRLCAPVVAHSAMRRGRFRDTQVRLRGEAFGPAFSYAPYLCTNGIACEGAPRRTFVRQHQRWIAVFTYRSPAFQKRSLGAVMGMIRRPCTPVPWAYR